MERKQKKGGWKKIMTIDMQSTWMCTHMQINGISLKRSFIQYWIKMFIVCLVWKSKWISFFCIYVIRNEFAVLWYINHLCMCECALRGVCTKCFNYPNHIANCLFTFQWKHIFIGMHNKLKRNDEHSLEIDAENKKLRKRKSRVKWKNKNWMKKKQHLVSWRFMKWE